MSVSRGERRGARGEGRGARGERREARGEGRESDRDVGVWRGELATAMRSHGTRPRGAGARATEYRVRVARGWVDDG
jgi:hypothetical protein